MKVQGLNWKKSKKLKVIGHLETYFKKLKKFTWVVGVIQKYIKCKSLKYKLELNQRNYWKFRDLIEQN